MTERISGSMELCKTQLHDLPNEVTDIYGMDMSYCNITSFITFCFYSLKVLAEIFKCMPFLECDKIMTVCRRWEAIVDQLVGLRAYIGRPSEFWSITGNDWKHIDWISSVGTSTVSFSDIEYSETEVKNLPLFKYPNLVKRVSFDGFVSQETFVHLLDPICNLAYLELHLSSLEAIDLSSAKLNFPKLQELIISSNNYTLEHMASRNLGQVMINCTNLLAVPYFPRLITLRLYIPIVVQKSAQLLRALFKFLLRHNTTMNMFLIRTDVTVSLMDEDSRPHDPIDMTPEIILLKTHKLPLPIFRGTFWAGDLPFLDFFRGLLNQQRAMTWCGFVTHEDFRPFPQHLIKQNYRTLQKLHLSIGVVDVAGNSAPMDCVHLKECVSLEHIGFIGNRTVENTEGVMVPDLSNAESLPKTLQFVEIYNILIGTQDVHLMASALPRLRTLHLENIGVHGDLGMSAETLVYIMKENKIGKIGVLSGFNENSLRHHAPEDEPLLRITRLYLNKESKPSFVATSFKDGKLQWGYSEEAEKFT